MAIRAVPLQGDVVDFDRPGSFVFTLQQATVLIRPTVLEGMLNESVFNYPHSHIRSLHVTLRPENERQAVIMSGQMKLGIAWIPFSMVSFLTVDQQTNTLVMNIDRIKVLGFIPATKLVKMEPLKLENLVTLPPNNSMIIRDDKIMVKPFGLFPPPRVIGRMTAVSTNESGIRLAFAGQTIPAPESTARNYVYLRGGIAKFGNFQMLDTDVLILDQNPSNPFAFSLARYRDLIPRSNIEVQGTKSVQVQMPDS
jgi:hypothetical protein